MSTYSRVYTDTYIQTKHTYGDIDPSSINRINRFIQSFIQPDPNMATESNSQTLWDSVPWQEWRVDLSLTGESGDKNKNNSNKPIIGWHKPTVPYIEGANKLQNLHVWVPSSSHTSEPPKDAKILSRKGIWIVYIHGGAWRDPLIKADSFAPTLYHIVKSHASSLDWIAGFASLDYTLSGGGDKGGGPDSDQSRTGKHPDHVVDVLRGVAFLQEIIGFAENYILLGHSCGATLSFQVLMDSARWVAPRLSGGERTGSTPSVPSPPKVTKPITVIGLDGIYDLPGLVKDPGEKHARWIPEYEAFTREAFGDDEKTWLEVSPISVKDWVGEWGRNDGKVVLVQSHDDTLVPYRQLEGMRAALKPAVAAGVDVFELSASGDHDSLWETGNQIASIVVEVLGRLS